MQSCATGRRALAALTIGLLVAFASSMPAHAEPPPVGANAVCPVDGDEAKARFGIEHEGQKVYLCCGRCARTFRQDPDRYTQIAADLPRVVDAEPDDADEPAEPEVAADDAHDDARAHDHDHAHEHAHVDEADDVHDHDHAHEDGLGAFLHWLGHFHVVSVHFPLGLLLAGAVGEVLSLLTRQRWLHDGVRFCVWAGMLGTLVAVPLGWLLLGWEFRHDDAITAAHRWLGTMMLVWAVALVIVMERARRAAGSGWAWAYRLTLWLGAIALGVTGHLGGMLVHGEDYLTW